MSAKRRKALEQVAFELGLKFLDKQDQSALIYLRDFRLFGIGGGKKISNLMAKTDPLLETELQIFDYRYVVSTGKTTAAFNQTVFFIQSKRLGLPQFLMQPETIFHRFKEFLGFRKDINFEEFPVFSKQYHLQGKDEDYIRASFSSDMLQLFTVEPDWHLEGVNYYLVLYRNRTLLAPADIQHLYTMGMKLVEFVADDRWPMHGP